MNMQMRSKIGPAGTHEAKLTSIEPLVSRYGPAYRWVFTIDEGPSQGMELTKQTGTQPRKETGLGNLLDSLYGREISVGESVDPESDLVGKRFEVFAAPYARGDVAVVQTVRPITTE